MTQSEMLAAIQAAIQSSSLSASIKNQRVAISTIVLGALNPVEITGYKTTSLGVVQPEELLVKCEPVALNRKPLYRFTVE